MAMYRYLAHTSDTRLYVEAEDLSGLFRVALEGMNQILRKDACLDPMEKPLAVPLAVDSMDASTLLVDFLAEVLYHSYQEKRLFCRVEFEMLNSEGYLEATIWGKPTEGFDKEIKAVTYHEVDIQKNEKGNYHTVIIVDL